MTDVNRGNVRLIASEDDARTLYKTTPPTISGKIGLEVEIPLYRPGRLKPETPTAEDITRIQQWLRQRGYDAQLESSGVLEYASPPVPLAELPQLIQQAHKDLKVFDEAIAAHGFARAPFCIVPTTTVQDALDHKVARERLEVLIRDIGETYTPESLYIPLLAAGVQANFSPVSNDELFRQTYRGYALTPLLFAALNSSSGFANNNPKRIDVHIRGSAYDGYKENACGVSKALLKSHNADEFIRNHVTEVFDTHIFFAYDLEGKIIPSTKEDPLTFRKLIARGLNTQSNYELAESFTYSDIKIANLRDHDGISIGKRVEVRAADYGPHQPFSTLLLTAALLPNGPTAEKFDALLRDYGFTGHPPQDAERLTAARKAAVEHRGNYLDVPFGTGTLRDFAADVAGLLVEHYGHDRGLSADVSTLVEILLTGECDAKKHAATYKTLQDVTKALQKTAVRKVDISPLPPDAPKVA